MTVNQSSSCALKLTNSAVDITFVPHVTQKELAESVRM